MSSRHSLDIYLVVIALGVVVQHTICEEAPISRALDLSIPSWRPLVQNPYQHQYYQNPAPKLISYTHLDPSQKEEIIEAAKINAQTLRKYNELAGHQPITSYSNPYPLYTQTPGPHGKTASTVSFINNPSIVRQPQAVAASNLMHSLLPYPKSSALYSTKLNFLGKPELSHHHHHIGVHQNSIHQTIATTPKVAGYTKDQGGRVNFHYHHPSFGMSSIFDSTTKRIPMFGSSVSPHSPTKVHPVMSKLQAHMALAALSQQQNQHKHNKMKIAQQQLQQHHQQHQQQQSQHRPNSGAPSSSSNEFSPPSQIVSNYANYETATRVPMWHHGFQSSKNQASGSHGGNSHAESQQLVLPSVHPSIITPFLEQIQIKQKEAPSHAEQKHTFKQSHDSSGSSSSTSSENNNSFEVVNDVFSKHLVPPPPSASSSSSSNVNSQSSKTRFNKGKDKHSKFNLSMPSPLQDASRFNYNNVISTATPSSTSTTHQTHQQPSYDKFRPIHHESPSGADKPNVFANLNRSKDNPYKQHKQLHPSYSGPPKKQHQQQQQYYQQSVPSSPQTFNQQEKPPFLPTPYEPSKQVEDIKIDFEQPQHHSFFTIEDAVTPHLSESHQHQNQFNDEFEIITLRPQIRPTFASYTAGPSLFSSTSQVTPSTTAAPEIIVSSPKPKGKLRRRKPKPHLQQQQQSSQKVPIKEVKEMSHEDISTTHRPPTAPGGTRTRGSIRNNNSTHDTTNELRTRNRLNHPNRVRTRPNFTSPSATLSTAADYDYTLNPVEAERKHEVSPTQVTTEGTRSTEQFAEQPDVSVKHRVRLRYKNKLNIKNAIEGDFKQSHKLSGDNQISDSENENVVVVKQQQSNDEQQPNEFVVTKNPFNEIKSSLKLTNLKLRNEILTTVASTESTTSTSTSTTTAAVVNSNEHDESGNVLHKVANNRPRFSIKELKRKQFLTSSTAPGVSTTVLTSSTSSTTPRPDGLRFNRYRLNLTRRRNETNDFNEQQQEGGSNGELTRKRYSSSTRFSSSSSPTSTTENPPTPSKRGHTLPKRTFPVRNFTKPTTQNVDNETTHKPSFISKSSTHRPSLRTRIQNHKRKESTALNEISNEHEELIKNVNLNTDTTIPHDPIITTTTTSTSTEMPITRETSIMKIAKTPSSLSSPQPSNSIKATTSNSVEDTLPSSTLSERHDTTDLIGSPSEHSQRVAELTISANENDSFNSANIRQLSRRIPNYFTISTDDPILPIQSFFPSLHLKSGDQEQ